MVRNTSDKGKITHNQAGGTGVTLIAASYEDEMQAYDRLPAPIRRTLREAYFCFSALECVEDMQKYEYTPNDVLRSLTEAESDKLSSGELSTASKYGVTHPQAVKTQKLIKK